jgi:hypothetical protein
MQGTMDASGRRPSGPQLSPEMWSLLPGLQGITGPAMQAAVRNNMQPGSTVSVVSKLPNILLEDTLTNKFYLSMSIYITQA